MTKSFQKSAKTPRELQISHPGIIDTDDFNKHFELHCYEPSPDLRPFVVHIWTQRLKQPFDPTYKPPTEIVSGPHAYLFFTPDSTYVHGVAMHAFAYKSLTPGVIAGVKFRPGGFYSFLQRPVSELHTTTLPAVSVFPEADTAFTETLLAQPDAKIVRTVETLLRSNHPKSDKNLRLVTAIMQALAGGSLRTVSATAQAFGMSERSLQLLFQTYVGVGVKWIIARRRLLEAIKRAQAQPQITWVEVAAELGYSSQSHFSRDFKEVIGTTPSEYSKRLKQRIL